MFNEILQKVKPFILARYKRTHSMDSTKNRDTPYFVFTIPRKIVDGFNMDKEFDVYTSGAAIIYVQTGSKL